MLSQNATSFLFIILFSWSSFAQLEKCGTSAPSSRQGVSEMSSRLNTCDPKNFASEIPKASAKDVALSCGAAGLGAAINILPKVLGRVVAGLTAPVSMGLLAYELDQAMEEDEKCYNNVALKKALIHVFNTPLENYYKQYCLNKSGDANCSQLGKLKINDYNCVPAEDAWSEKNNYMNCSENTLGAGYLKERSCMDLKAQIVEKQKILNAYWGKRNSTAEHKQWQKLNEKYEEESAFDQIFTKYQIPFACLDLNTKTAAFCDAFALISVAGGLVTGATKAAGERLARLRSPKAMNSVERAQAERMYEAEVNTRPSMAKDVNRKPIGDPADVKAVGKNPGMAEDIALQNEVTEVLSQQGFKVERLADHHHLTAEERAAARANAQKRADQRQPTEERSRTNPDLKIEDRVFDVYAPRADTKPGNIASKVISKVTNGQTERVVVYMKRNQATVEQLRSEIVKRELMHPSSLKEVMGVDATGNVVHIYP